MVAITRARYAEIFQRVIADCIQISDGAQVLDALKSSGVTNMDAFLSMDLEVINELHFTHEEDDGTFSTSPINKGYKRAIVNLITWMHQKQRAAPGGILTEEDWDLVTADSLFEYTISLDNLNPNSNIGNLRPTISGTPTPFSHERSELEMFKRGTKRDITVYPTLRDDKTWDTWNRTVLTHARTHDISEVFNVDYVPTNDMSIALFEQKQSFVYSMFNKCVLTDVGKTLVRLHEKTFNAQLVYKGLVEHAKRSTAAVLNIEKHVEYLTVTKLDSRWQGTTTGFILNWRDKMRMLEELTPPSEHFSDGIKKRMLESAVRQITELRQVKLYDEHAQATGGPTLTYTAYFDLLMSAATRRDNEIKLPAQRSRRTINKASSNYDYDSSDQFESGYIDYDNSHLDYVSDHNDYTSIEVNAMETRRNHIPGEIWKLLPEEAHEYFRQQNAQRPSTSLSPHKTRFSKPFQRQAKTHMLDEVDNTDYEACNDEALPSDTGNEDVNIETIVNKTEQVKLHPGDVRSVVSSAQKSTGKPPSIFKPSVNPNDYVMIRGKKYYAANTHFIIYSTHSRNLVPQKGSLVDRGANGGIAGSDVIMLEQSHRKCDVTGIDNHTMQNLPIGTCAGLVRSTKGPIIIILHQYAYSGKGSTIHSSAQIESFGHTVDDKSKMVNGHQRILTSNGYTIPLHFRNGLPYLDLSQPTSIDMQQYPHIAFTSDVDWDPSKLDNDGNYDSSDDDSTNVNIGHDSTTVTPDYGSYTAITNISVSAASLEYDLDHSASFSDFVDKLVDTVMVHKHSIVIKEPHYEELRPNFAWAPTNIIKKTFECTTQWARMIERYPFRKHFKSRFPALNVIRRNEIVATDTIFADTPAFGTTYRLAQIFVGTTTFVTDVYPMKRESDFLNTLQENIRKRGAMDKLASDSANVEISANVKDLLRHYMIDDWQSEPYHEHQNPAERRYQTVKRYTNVILDRTGAPPAAWLMCMQYVCHVLNLLVVDSINKPPLQALTGQTQDISILLTFHFWEPVYYATADLLSYNSKVSFPSQTSEAKARFVGFGESVGDALTFKVFTDNTNKIIYRSAVRSVLDSTRNLRLELLEGETALPYDSDDDPTLNEEHFLSTDMGIDTTVMGSSTNYTQHYNSDTSTPNSNSVTNQPSPDDLINRTYLTTPDSKGQRFRAKIKEKVFNHELSSKEQELAENTKFVISTGDNLNEEIISYNEVLDHLDKQLDVSLDPEQVYWQFKSILAHEGPLTKDSNSYKGSIYNVKVAWEDGSETYEPLHTIATDDPVTCAIYARDNNLLDLPGWKQFKSIARREQKLQRMVNQTKRHSLRTAPIYKVGFRVPRNLKEAMEIDKENNNTKWADAILTEITQIHDYNTFKNLGRNGTIPPGYKRIRVHFVFDIKHDGRHKARLVAGGHLTDEPDESVYSGVVTLRGLRLAIFVGELNDLVTWGADVGNAYLESYTKEKVYIIAGPEFNELQGCVLVVNKALYGLRSSGLRWHERFADTLRDLGFKPCKADPDIWMRPTENRYEYIAVYVDDLAIIAKDPETITKLLVEKYNYKLKGVGPIDYHLGGNFARDSDNTLRYGPRKYIDKLIATYEKTFGTKPTEYVSPLIKGDNPELDDSPEVDKEDIKQYQSMIGALQWTVSIGRFDILAAVMTMSRFRIAPRIGHLDRLKRIYGYLKRFKHGAIRFRTGIPDYSQLEHKDYDWTNSVYGDYKEFIPNDVPKVLGNPVVTTTYVDANLMHCLVTGRSATGILHLVNGTPIEWYSKRQSTVETATYGSEFVAARIATDQVIDLRNTLRYMGVKVLESIMFGDNQSVITSATIPHSKLGKRHVALAYHRVREAIAGNIFKFYHIDGVINPADMLSKHAGYQQFWPMLRALLFWGVSHENLPEETTIDDAYGT
jgi:hypothetical protein